MVTEAGKELLRNTINTAKFHNKILEENEMWKQWELERGLTMMISDDDVLRKIRKSHRCSKHRKQEKSKEVSRNRHNVEKPTANSTNNVSDRWDHSGFLELYPDSINSKSFSSASSSKMSPKKWDHSGYRELYPNEVSSEKSSSSSSKVHLKKKHKKSKRKKRHHSQSSTSSDNEIWEEFKKYKRSKSKKERLEKTKSSSSGFDNHIKEWRKHKEKSK